LRESKDRWVPDISGLRKAASKKTKLIAVCNPNNPTGAILTDEEADEICRVARKVGAWILSDEVYQGAELDGRQTPTFWDRYDKVIVTNGLSKAYGLPGLRVGWAIAKRGLGSKLWSYHDYTTICPSALSDVLAQRVLQPKVRAKILSRANKILRENLPVVSDWVKRERECFWFVPPKGGAIALLKYNLNIGSRRLAEQLVREKSTLVVPGAHFKMGRYIRVGFGGSHDYLVAGLNRIADWVREHAELRRDS
jgi:aspartate/methionine/tyrosine aminotransferase